MSLTSTIRDAAILGLARKSDVNVENAEAVLGPIRDATINAANEAEAAVERLASYIDAYIDPANGVMADTLAFRAAIAAAGVGGEVRGKGTSTYTCYGAVEPLYGQHINGMGAKLKRGDAITTTTTSGVTSGVSFAVTVASAANFRVGMDIAIQSSATAGTSNRRITAINGNTITVSATFDATIASGATLTTSFMQISAGSSADAGPVLVERWEVDGNKANNNGFTTWTNHTAIRLAGKGCIIQHNYVHDCVGEGIYGQAYSSGSTSDDPYMIQFNQIVDVNGNGIHMSASTAAKVLYNSVKNTNLRPNGALGHDDGCIAFSFNGPDWWVVGNRCESGLAGISALGELTYKGKGLIADNVIRSCSVPIARSLVSELGGQVIVRNNKFYDSGEWLINQTGSYNTAYGFQNMLVQGNQLYNCRINVQKSFAILFSDNQIFNAGDTTNIPVNIFDCGRVSWNGGQITGGTYAFYVAGANCSAIRIKGADVYNPYNSGVTGDATLPVGSLDVSDVGVFVATGFTTASGFRGLQLTIGSRAINCRLLLEQVSPGGTSSGINCPSASTGVPAAIVQGCEVYAPNLTYTIRTSGGSMNNVIQNCVTNAAVSNGGGASNTLSNNTLRTIA